MLITLGLGSVTGLASGVIAIICDQRPKWNKTKVTFFICLAGFLVGLIYVTPVKRYIEFFSSDFYFSLKLICCYF